MDIKKEPFGSPILLRMLDHLNESNRVLARPKHTSEDKQIDPSSRAFADALPPQVVIPVS